MFVRFTSLQMVKEFTQERHPDIMLKILALHFQSVYKNQKFRLSGTKTIARPSFKEMSFASIIDPISGITFLGGMNAIDSWDGNLVKTDIYNADIRWELVMKHRLALMLTPRCLR